MTDQECIEFFYQVKGKKIILKHWKGKGQYFIPDRLNVPKNKDISGVNRDGNKECWVVGAGFNEWEYFEEETFHSQHHVADATRYALCSKHFETKYSKFLRGGIVKGEPSSTIVRTDHGPNHFHMGKDTDKPICECGARHTSYPDLHLNYCPLNKEKVS